MKEANLQEIMTKSLVTVRWNDPIMKAQELMEERRIRHLPVRDGSDNLIGIISDRDVNLALNSERTRFGDRAVVADFMTWPVLTVDENMSLNQVARGMVDEKISCFLVTRGGKEVVGIVTSEDLLRQFIQDCNSKVGAIPYSPVADEFMREISALGI